MKVLAVLPFGSRMYGTFDENSDWDWKRIILPPLEDLLIGVPIKNKFFSSSADTVKNTSDDTDTELVPIQTFASDVLDGQTYALEILFAVLRETPMDLAYAHPEFRTFCRTLYERFLTSNINAMVGYAYHQAELYSDKGNRLEKLHLFNDMLTNVLTTFPLAPTEKLGRIMHDASNYWVQFVDKMFYLTNSQNPDGTVQECFSLLEKLYPENITIAEAQTRVQSHIKKYGRRANQAMDNKGKDWKAISHAVRVVFEALDVLEHKWIVLPFTPDRADLLKQIKYGNVEWEVVQELLVSNIDKITEMQLVSTLPQKTDAMHLEFKEWLKNEMITFYGVGK
jgi:hypothetical protein